MLATIEGEAAAICTRWIDDAVESLIQPLTAINCLLNPDAVLIGGRLPLPLIERLSGALTTALGGCTFLPRPRSWPPSWHRMRRRSGRRSFPFLITCCHPTPS